MPLDRGSYQAIELAVKATGQQGVNDLGNSAQKAKTDFEAFQRQLQAGAPVNAQSVAELARLKAQVEQTAEAYFYCNRFFVTPSARPYILSYVEDTHTARSFRDVPP